MGGIFIGFAVAEVHSYIMKWLKRITSHAWRMKKKRRKKKRCN